MKELANILAMQAPKNDSEMGMMDVAQDILSAIEAKDASKLSNALSAYYNMYEMQPHEEYDHEGE